MMKWTIRSERSFSVLVLSIACIITTVVWVGLTIQALEKRMYIMGSAIQMSHIIMAYTILWVGASVGILGLRRWGWALVFGLGLFSLVTSTNLFLTQPVGNKFLPGFGIALSVAFLLILNVASVRKAYGVEPVQGQQQPGQFIGFAIVCITTGVFLFFELFTGFRVAPGTMVTRLFVNIIGLVFILLGFGIWKSNKSACQAVEPVLLFLLISLGLIFGKDYFDSTGHFRPIKSIFYLVLIGGLIIYWRFKLRINVGDFMNSQD